MGVAANHLESVAIYFVKGAADEEAAFPSIGSVFCYLVEIVAPIFYISRIKNNSSGSFKYVVKLYGIWSDRIKIDNLELTKADADREMSNITPDKLNILE